MRYPALAAVAVCLLPALAQAQIHVVSTTPALNDTAATTTEISIDFDRPLDTTTIDADSFRVLGRWSGTAQGTYTFSMDNRTVKLIPGQPLSAAVLLGSGTLIEVLVQKLAGVLLGQSFNTPTIGEVIVSAVLNVVVGMLVLGLVDAVTRRKLRRPGHASLR